MFYVQGNGISLHLASNILEISSDVFRWFPLYSLSRFTMGRGTGLANEVTGSEVSHWFSLCTICDLNLLSQSSARMGKVQDCRILQDIAGYCRILQDSYWILNTVEYYLGYLDLAAFVKRWNFKRSYQAVKLLGSWLKASWLPDKGRSQTCTLTVATGTKGRILPHHVSFDSHLISVQSIRVAGFCDSQKDLSGLNPCLFFLAKRLCLGNKC